MGLSRISHIRSSAAGQFERAGISVSRKTPKKKNLDFKEVVRYFITTLKFSKRGYIMRSTITISLPQQMRSELDGLSRSDGVSRSDIVRECLRDYMFIRRFRSTRKRLVEKAAQQGIFTDQDVFDRVS